LKDPPHLRSEVRVDRTGVEDRIHRTGVEDRIHRTGVEDRIRSTVPRLKSGARREVRVDRTWLGSWDFAGQVEVESGRGSSTYGVALHTNARMGTLGDPASFRTRPEASRPCGLEPDRGVMDEAR
jgi:hypothetical protein